MAFGCQKGGDQSTLNLTKKQTTRIKKGLILFNLADFWAILG
jgi:hypothetical protein